MPGESILFAATWQDRNFYLPWLTPNYYQVYINRIYYVNTRLYIRPWQRTLPLLGILIRMPPDSGRQSKLLFSLFFFLFWWVDVDLSIVDAEGRSRKTKQSETWKLKGFPSVFILCLLVYCENIYRCTWNYVHTRNTFFSYIRALVWHAVHTG